MAAINANSPMEATALLDVRAPFHRRWTNISKTSQPWSKVLETLILGLSASRRWPRASSSGGGSATALPLPRPLGPPDEQAFGREGDKRQNVAVTERNRWRQARGAGICEFMKIAFHEFIIRTKPAMRHGQSPYGRSWPNQLPEHTNCCWWRMPRDGVAR